MRHDTDDGAICWRHGFGSQRGRFETGAAWVAVGTMIPRALADLVLVLHLAFIVFVVLGGWLALRWPRVVWVHLPAVVWGIFIELTGGICPLTPLENVDARDALP